MLLALSWVMSLISTFYLAQKPFSYKNLLLIFGGIFLIVKSAMEIYSDIAPEKEIADKSKRGIS